MSPANPSPLEPSAFTADAVPATGFDGSVATGTEGTASAARQAVDSILSISDRVEGADGQTVNLRFSIGENDLHVRVGYAGGEVRTTFVTESPELRAMLLQEWQALSSAGTERSVRLADPVFGSAGQGDPPATNSSFDSPSQQHRDTAGRREAGFAPLLVRPAAAGADIVPAGSAAPARGLERSTQRLRTFA